MKTTGATQKPRINTTPPSTSPRFDTRIIHNFLEQIESRLDTSSHTKETLNKVIQVPDLSCLSLDNMNQIPNGLSLKLYQAYIIFGDKLQLNAEIIQQFNNRRYNPDLDPMSPNGNFSKQIEASKQLKANVDNRNLSQDIIQALDIEKKTQLDIRFQAEYLSDNNPVDLRSLDTAFIAADILLTITINNYSLIIDIEIDGHDHQHRIGKDRWRDVVLINLNPPIYTLRIPTSEIAKTNPDIPKDKLITFITNNVESMRNTLRIQASRPSSRASRSRSRSSSREPDHSPLLNSNESSSNSPGLGSNSRSFLPPPICVRGLAAERRLSTIPQSPHNPKGNDKIPTTPKTATESRKSSTCPWGQEPVPVDFEISDGSSSNSKGKDDQILASKKPNDPNDVEENRFESRSITQLFSSMLLFLYNYIFKVLSSVNFSTNNTNPQGHSKSSPKKKKRKKR